MKQTCAWLGVLFSLCLSAAQAAQDTVPGSSWLAEAQRELAQREYWISPNETGLQAPNREQGFRTYFDGDGIRLLARSAEGEPLATVTLAGMGRERDGVALEFSALGKAEVTPDAARITLQWPGIHADYDNQPDGLHQEIVVRHRPSGSGRLAVALDITGATLQVGPEVVVCEHSSGTLTLDAIAATDARGRALPVSLAAEAGRLVFAIDDRSAAYPITLKTLLTGNIDAQLQLNQAGAQLGFSVAGAGDVNGDGFADVIVGANLYDNAEIDEGAAFVYFGGAGTFNLSPDAVLDSNRAGARLGASVAGAGDVNGDGYADVIVGTGDYDNPLNNEGAAFIFFGGIGAFNLAPDAQLEVNQAGAFLGASVAGAGDVNGDGFADVIAGAPGYDNGESSEGAAFIYFGGTGAFDLSPDAQLESNQVGAFLGASVSGAGDVNGDGFADVIVGANFYDNGLTDEGVAFVYFGAAGAFNITPDAQLESNQADARLGSSVAGAGDVNGDGYADVIVGANQYDNGLIDEGAAFIYFGGVGPFNLTPDAQLESNQASALLGGSVAGAGDVNGDGYADVIVGAYRFDNVESEEGAAFFYYGGAGAFEATPDGRVESNQVNGGMGFSVAGAGDVNGDGFADVLVGAPFYDSGQAEEGTAFVYFGGAGAFNLTADGQLESNQTDALFGNVDGAGDVNGDGFADVIVGAAGYDNGQTSEGVAFIYFGGTGAFDFSPDALLEANLAGAGFGGSAAGAGDVNGDGFADVIVGASTYADDTNNEGVAFVFFGGAAPFNLEPDARLEANRTFVFFGGSVAGAGDVNGDGFADVIVGAFNYNHGGGATGTGAAFLYFGGAGPFDLTPDALLGANEGGGFFGYSVAGAGDVNGDGFADVIVGAYSNNNGQDGEGAAFIYFGSAGPFNLAHDARLDSNQTFASFGFSVAGAGDVNGDGFADVIVGATSYDFPEIDEGAAFIYFGGAGAFNITPDSVLDSDQAAARLGTSVAGAGDVNGDGYADVIVGAPAYDGGLVDEGEAIVYLGGPGPFNLTPDARLESNQANARLGGSVAGAGDVNGDGFADVIVGAGRYDNGQTDEGSAFLYFGTARGRPVLAGQYRGGGAGPVQAFGLSQQADGFVVALEATSPRGRERARLQLDACPPGAPFGSLLCTRFTATSWTELTDATGTTLALTATGLDLNRVYHWRARVQYAALGVIQSGIVSPPNPAAGPWRRLQANAGVADIRTSVPLTPGIFSNGFE